MMSGDTRDAREVLGPYTSPTNRRTAEIINWLRIVWWCDEQAARAAIDPDRPGTHWEWIDPATDRPAGPDPHGYYHGASLRTAEHVPSGSVGDLPAFIIHTAEKMTAGAASHIARNDPAGVLARIDAERAIAELWERMMTAKEENSRKFVDVINSPGGPVPSPEFAEHTERKASLGRHGVRLGGICDALSEVIVHLAYGYRERADYRQEWAP